MKVKFFVKRANESFEDFEERIDDFTCHRAVKEIQTEMTTLAGDIVVLVTVCYG